MTLVFTKVFDLRGDDPLNYYTRISFRMTRRQLPDALYYTYHDFKLIGIWKIKLKRKLKQKL